MTGVADAHPAAPRGRRGARLLRGFREYLPATIVFLLALIAWEVISGSSSRRIIPPPSSIAGAMARDELGRWEYDVGAGGDSTREMSFRMGVNLVMYALCLDYKDDQVHIPFILQRRR